VVFPPGWQERAGALLGRYEELAAAHTRCGKHRRPKENLTILRTAARDVADGRELPPRTRGMLRHAVDSMLARRGQPGSAEHTALRCAQAREATVPAHHQLASAAGYPDRASRTLMAATYRAFRSRRSLLLLDLQHQVRLAELPWVQALRPHRRPARTSATKRTPPCGASVSWPSTGFPPPCCPTLSYGNWRPCPRMPA
jgi:hypothetical protein